MAAVAVSKNRLKTRSAIQLRDRVVHIRLSVDEAVAVNGAAKAAGLTVSSFIRSLALEGAGVSPFFTEEDLFILDLLLADMRAVAASLNLAARRRDTGAVANVELAESLTNVQALAAALIIELSDYASRGRQKRRGDV